LCQSPCRSQKRYLTHVGLTSCPYYAAHGQHGQQFQLARISGQVSDNLDAPGTDFATWDITDLSLHCVLNPIWTGAKSPTHSLTASGRKARGYSQEDMISFGFSARHWQQVEAGRPITVTTLMRICEVFEIPMSSLVRGLDAGIMNRLTSISCFVGSAAKAPNDQTLAQTSSPWPANQHHASFPDS
jgi:transcriptional regulator with XRE-family HTH domain